MRVSIHALWGQFGSSFESFILSDHFLEILKASSQLGHFLVDHVPIHFEM